MSRYLFSLDGYTFPDLEEPAFGPIIYTQPQNWASADALGSTGTGATIYQFTGLKSQVWDLTSHASSATKDKLLAVYNARAAVVWKTPQDTTGINVLMTKLAVQYPTPLGFSLFGCSFTLVQR